MLPASIAQKLKRQVGIVAEGFDDVSVLFADIVGFTAMAARLSPKDLVEMLNRIFSNFDELVEKHGVEKIKTIGDAYMVAGGLPEPSKDHLASMASLALDMLDQARELHFKDGINLRIGLHSGHVIAGVIGIRKFIYDVWGETVNTASRIESHGLPGRVHVSETVAERLRGRFIFEPRGLVEIKGRDPMHTYFLLRPTP